MLKLKGLVSYLKYGKENGVSLDDLAILTGMKKRAVRDEINRINTAGEEIICNSGDGSGYYIAADIEEAKAYRAYNRSYWKSGIEKDKGIARCMERRFSGQIEMEI